MELEIYRHMHNLISTKQSISHQLLSKVDARIPNACALKRMMTTISHSPKLMPYSIMIKSPWDMIQHKTNMFTKSEASNEFIQSKHIKFLSNLNAILLEVCFAY